MPIKTSFLVVVVGFKRFEGWESWTGPESDPDYPGFRFHHLFPGWSVYRRRNPLTSGSAEPSHRVRQTSFLARTVQHQQGNFLHNSQEACSIWLYALFMQKESAVNSWRWHKERVLAFEDYFWLVIRVSGVSEF
jgi:hypothetical protein